MAKVTALKFNKNGKFAEAIYRNNIVTKKKLEEEIKKLDTNRTRTQKHIELTKLSFANRIKIKHDKWANDIEKRLMRQGHLSIENFEKYIEFKYNRDHDLYRNPTKSCRARALLNIYTIPPLQEDDEDEDYIEPVKLSNTINYNAKDELDLFPNNFEVTNSKHHKNYHLPYKNKLPPSTLPIYSQNKYPKSLNSVQTQPVQIKITVDDTTTATVLPSTITDEKHKTQTGKENLIIKIPETTQENHLKIPSLDLNDIPYGQSVSSGSTSSSVFDASSTRSSPRVNSNVRFRLPVIVASVGSAATNSPRHGSPSWKINEIFNNKHTHALPKSSRLQNFVLNQGDLKLPPLSQQAVTTFNANNYFSHAPPTRIKSSSFIKNVSSSNSASTNTTTTSKSTGHVSLLTSTGDYDKRFLNLMYTLGNVKTVRSRAKK